jgi:hypothetical protein
MKDIEKRRTPKELFVSFVFLFFLRADCFSRARRLLCALSRGPIVSPACVVFLSRYIVYAPVLLTWSSFLPPFLSFLSRIDRFIIFLTAQDFAWISYSRQHGVDMKAWTATF